MCLSMQNEIDDFHIWAQSNHIEIPKIKCLKVIPTITFIRKPVEMDSDVLYRMLAERKKLSVMVGTKLLATATYVYKHKTKFWHSIFDFDKIDKVSEYFWI